MDQLKSEKEQRLKEALLWILNILNKHDIRYQITGGLAAHIYGAKRDINDIDLDIPDEAIYKIEEDVKGFITEGPKRYRDKKWDLNLLTLSFKGQEIDLGGAYATRLFNESLLKWEPFPADLDTARDMSFLGIRVKVVDPYDLIEYKKVLSGDHQLRDIEEIISNLGI